MLLQWDQYMGLHTRKGDNLDRIKISETQLRVTPSTQKSSQI